MSFYLVNINNTSQSLNDINIEEKHILKNNKIWNIDNSNMLVWNTRSITLNLFDYLNENYKSNFSIREFSNDELINIFNYYIDNLELVGIKFNFIGERVENKYDESDVRLNICLQNTIRKIENEVYNKYDLHLAKSDFAKLLNRFSIGFRYITIRKKVHSGYIDFAIYRNSKLLITSSYVPIEELNSSMDTNDIIEILVLNIYSEILKEISLIDKISNPLYKELALFSNYYKW